MEKITSISITTGTFIRALFVGALAYAVWKLHLLLLLVLTAIVIASAIEPGVNFFVRHRIPRIIAVLFMYLAVFGTIFSVIYFFLPPLFIDAQGLAATLPQFINGLNLPGAGLPTFAPSTGQGASSLISTLFSFRAAFMNSTNGTFQVVASFFGGIFSLGIVIVLSFYFAIQETGVESFLRLVVPPKNEAYIVNLWHRAQRKIGLWMQGQVLSSLIGGTIAFLGLLILGVPYALILAVFTALAMLVPIFGSFLAAFPAVLVAYTSGGLPLALIVAGLYLIINQFEAHLIHPLVVNKVVGIPPLLIILALIIGEELAGFLGVLLAIPLAAALRELITDYDKGKRSAQILP
jgi:predicted PurR-regulated permease PerM